MDKLPPDVARITQVVKNNLYGDPEIIAITPDSNRFNLNKILSGIKDVPLINNDAVK